MLKEEEYNKIVENIMECMPDEFAHFEELLVLEMTKSVLTTTHLIELSKEIKDKKLEEEGK